MVAPISGIIRWLKMFTKVLQLVIFKRQTPTLKNIHEVYDT